MRWNLVLISSILCSSSPSLAFLAPISVSKAPCCPSQHRCRPASATFMVAEGQGPGSRTDSISRTELRAVTLGTSEDVTSRSKPLDERGPLRETGRLTKGASFNKAIVGILKGILSSYFGERHFARFYALETIARVPYFSYMSMLHLYETLGWWRKGEYLKIHFAESWNEYHHLLIMEELGGSDRFSDKVVAQHIAVFYYFAVCFLYAVSPENAYNLNQHVEEHAFSTYAEFVKAQEEMLKGLPAPAVAKEYYEKDKLYIFNGLHNSIDNFDAVDGARPKCDTLYDVFCLIRDDEAQHVLTMAAMQEPDENILARHD